MIAFMVAGTASGAGKTTCSLALMAAFRRRGLTVQPFKCGPDFLDIGHHTSICGRSSRNLDTWMLDKQANRELFSQASAGADVAVVEGMMGLFDGVAGGTERGSSAEIAKLLDIPVVLVLDASKSSRSIAAVVKGFETFDPGVRFGGIILNGVASDTGGMRRTHVRKHDNTLKRQLIHVGAFNLSLIFRRLLGAETPRECNNLGRAIFLFLLALFTRREQRDRPCRNSNCGLPADCSAKPSFRTPIRPCQKFATYTTGC